MQPFRGDVTTVGYEDWLFIAWVFSSRKFFERVSKSLVPRVVVDEDETGRRVVSWAAHKGRGRDRLRQFDSYVPEVILSRLIPSCLLSGVWQWGFPGGSTADEV